jgi:hypothetical protein
MRSKQKSRRGSTLVLVALMLGAFMGVAAIAADIGRFYVVAGELQTAADAAALKGAGTLQFLTSNYASTVDTVMRFASSTNRADGDSVVIAADSINVGFWTPGSGGAEGSFVSPAPVGSRPNAVSVKAYGAPRGVFAQMIGRTAGLRLTRRAIAWVGNVSLNCTRPWALSYLPLVQKVNLNSDTTKDLNMASFVTYANSSVANRTMVMKNSVTGGTWPTDDGTWTAYNLPSLDNGGANAGQPTYQSQITKCSNIAVNSDAGNGDIQPSNGNGPCGAGTVVCWAIEAMSGLNSGPQQAQGPGICDFQPNDATCYDKQSGAAGATVDVTFANILCNGANCIDFKYVGETTLACVFQLSTDVCNAIPSPRVKTGYAPGTLVVVTQGLKSRTLNPTDIISNAPSNVQMLFLVK